MKLWIFSDLHLEMFPLERPLDIPDADICVVAGDILNRGIVPSLRWLEDYIGKHMPVVFVAGNHEFYRASLVESLVGASKFGSDGSVHFLEDKSVEIGGVLYCGATLWTDYRIFGDEWAEPGMRNALTSMNDYRLVNYTDNPYAGLRPIHTCRIHTRSRAFIEKCLTENPGKKIVVVTHHAISPLSVEEQYRDDLLTTAFASNLDALILDKGPALWVHGHVHHRCDYVLGKTRVVCNPRGYHGEDSYWSFDPALVIDL